MKTLFQKLTFFRTHILSCVKFLPMWLFMYEKLCKMNLFVDFVNFKDLREIQHF